MEKTLLNALHPIVSPQRFEYLDHLCVAQLGRYDSVTISDESKLNPSKIYNLYLL